MSKPTLVMIHGLAGSLHYFDPQSRITGAEVHCCDLLGYGEHRRTEEDRLTLSAQVEHVERYLEQFGTGPVWLLGHSMGGAVVMLLADRRADLVAGLINVEGNFTLKDAFWSGSIIRNSPAEWADEYRALRANLPATTKSWSISPNPQRIEWIGRILDNQPAETVYRMSEAIVAETRPTAYLGTVRRVVDADIPCHLIAGEKSAAAWDLPEFVRRAARSYAQQPGAGHLMMLEDPDRFCALVGSILTGG